MILKHIKWKQWLGLALLIRLSLFLLFAYYFQHDANHQVINGLFVEGGDTYSYYDPLETLIDGHGYGFYNENDQVFEPFALRMPGLAPIYLPLRLFFDEPIAKVCMIFIQLLGSFLTLWFIGKISLFLVSNTVIAGLSMVIMAGSSFVNVYDHYGLSESLNITTYLASIYFLTLFLERNKWQDILLSGTMLTWSLFIRPVVGFHLVLMPLVVLFWMAKKRPFVMTGYIRSMLLFGMVPLLSLGAWTYRNFVQFNKLIPLQMTVAEALPGAFPPHRIECMEFITSMGQDMVDFSDYTMGDWFFDNSYSKGEFDLGVIPETSVYNRDSILQLRHDYQLVRFNKIIGSEAEALKASIAGRAKRYRLSLKAEKPFYYYVTAKIKLIGFFIFHRKLITPLPFPALPEMSIVQVGIKSLNFLMLHFVTYLGLLGVLLSAVKGSFKERLFAVFPLAFILVMPVLVGYVEQRYFIHAYMLLLPFALMFIYRVVVRSGKIPYRSGESHI